MRTLGRLYAADSIQIGRDGGAGIAGASGVSRTLAFKVPSGRLLWTLQLAFYPSSGAAPSAFTSSVFALFPLARDPNTREVARLRRITTDTDGDDTGTMSLPDSWSARGQAGGFEVDYTLANTTKAGEWRAALHVEPADDGMCQEEFEALAAACDLGAVPSVALTGSAS